MALQPYGSSSPNLFRIAIYGRYLAIIKDSIMKLIFQSAAILGLVLLGSMSPPVQAFNPCNPELQKC